MHVKRDDDYGYLHHILRVSSRSNRLCVEEGKGYNVSCDILFFLLQQTVCCYCYSAGVKENQVHQDHRVP